MINPAIELTSPRRIFAMVLVLCASTNCASTNCIADGDQWTAIGIHENEPPIIVGRYYDSESLRFGWETDPQIIRSLLPQPLEPTDSNRVSCGITNNRQVDFVHNHSKGTKAYMLSTLSIPCQYRGIRGSYTLNLIEDDDYAVFSGREKIGFPKKMGKLFLKRDGRRISAYIERRGIRLVEIEAELTADMPPIPPESERRAPLTGQLTPESAYAWSGFMFKWLPKHTGGFDYGPVMSRQANISGPGFSRPAVRAEAKIISLEITPSPYDSVFSRLKMVTPPTSATYMVGGCFTMLSSEVVEEVEVDPKAFEPHAWHKYDY